MAGKLKKMIRLLGIPKLLLITAAGIILLIPFNKTVKQPARSDTVTEINNINEHEDSGSNSENKLSSLLSQVKGIGKTRVMIAEDKGRVTGVLVAAGSGDDAAVKKEIIEAVEVLFELEAHKIKVMKLE